MPVTAGLLLASALMAQLPAEPGRPGAPGVDIVGPDRSGEQGRSGETGAPADPGERRHRFGLGGATSIGTGGLGGSVRFFPSERWGMNAAVGYYPRFGPRSSGGTFVGAPSFIYMLKPINLDAEIDLRPYVGAGVSLASGAGTAIGHQEMGGVELTFKNVNDLTISAEVVHHELRITGSRIPPIQGTNFYLTFHFYFN